MTSVEILLCTVLVSISAFLSGSEVALFSLSRFQLRYLRDQFKTIHHRIRKLLNDPAGLLVTILIANEMVNISLSIVITEAIIKNWDQVGFWVPDFFQARLPSWLLQMLGGVVITTPILLILCEISPKVVAARANQFIASIASGPLGMIYSLFHPMRFLVRGLLKIITRQLGQDTLDPSDSVGKMRLKEDEFLFMVEKGHKEGMIHETELDLIKNVFDLDDTDVKEIYTPIRAVHVIPKTMSVRKATELALKEEYSRIPVIGTSKTDVLGVLYSKDLLEAQINPELLDQPVTNLMREKLSVSPTMKVNALFRKMKQSKRHLAVVIDEKEQAALGIVTMGDILEEIFDDFLLPKIKDEEVGI